MAEPLLRRTLSRLRRRERRGAGRAEAEEGGGSRRSGREEPQNHREEPQNHRVEPQNHRVEPLNHRVEPQNHRVEPLNHRVEPQNHRVEPLNSVEPQNRREEPQNDRVEPLNHRVEPLNRREEPQNRSGEPPNLKEEPQSHREEPRARRPEPDGAEPWEEAEAGGGPPVLGGPGRPPGPGAYLQSLERSSRRWVLAGKGAEDAGATGHGDSGAARGDIWYNPIPEDEDDEGTRGEGTPKGLGTTEGHGDRGEEAGAGRGQASGKPPEPPSPPGKGRPLPKCKSPGPVRRLSLKMKKLPELRRKLSLRSPRPRDADGAGGCPSPPESRRESRNVISRYHLDSSVGWALPRGGSGRAGHRSDGDSPELPARPGGPADPGLDLGAFRPYEDPAARGSAVLSGLLSVQLRGLRPAWPERLFCVLQVDGASRARTALLAGGAEFLRLDHCFNLELERARLLSVAVLAWDGSAGRNRLLCHGSVGLARLFEGGRSQALALALRPRAVLFCRLSLSLSLSPPQPRVAPGPRVFGVELSQLVAREGHPGQVPLLVLKCLAEIERRGLAVVGLYRLCGSAAAKKELRDAFERDSAAVALSERLCPDINVVTGILKDFLRELPSPLVPPRLQRSVLEAMAQRPPRDPPGDPAALLECLRPPERATLRRLLSHLSLVAALQRWNRMGSQNLAVCFGPVLLPPHTCAGEAARPRGQQGQQGQPPGQQGQQGHPPGQQGQQGQEPAEDAAGAVDFKRHLEVLHYLLRVWPVPPLPAWAEAPRGRPSALALSDPPVVAPGDPPVVAPGDPPVVARSRPRGPESPPSNRYAGDWSVCDPRGAPGDSDGDTAGTAPQTLPQSPSQTLPQIPPQIPPETPPQILPQIPPQTRPQNPPQNSLQTPPQSPPRSQTRPPPQIPSQNLPQTRPPPQNLPQIPPQNLPQTRPPPQNLPQIPPPPQNLPQIPPPPQNLPQTPPQTPPGTPPHTPLLGNLGSGPDLGLGEDLGPDLGSDLGPDLGPVTDLGSGADLGSDLGSGSGPRLTLKDFDALIRELERELGTRPDVGL